VTGGQTDGQNYDSQDRASIAASRGNYRDMMTQRPCTHSQYISDGVLNALTCDRLTRFEAVVAVTLRSSEHIHISQLIILYTIHVTYSR